MELLKKFETKTLILMIVLVIAFFMVIFKILSMKSFEAQLSSVIQREEKKIQTEKVEKIEEKNNNIPETTITVSE